MTTRTQDEILARFKDLNGTTNDFFGFRSEVLIESMDEATLKVAAPHYDPREEDGELSFPITPADQLSEKAAGYLAFAITKAMDHRGISAGRSVDKLREYAWLLGRDDIVEAMDEAGYENYGAPKLKAFAEGMELPFVVNEYYEQEHLDRMAQGKTCRRGCEEGCGR